jgi:23S rRNA pseudouridine955/2504/2580 synthase
MKSLNTIEESILWQDKDLLLIAKPPGVSTLFDRSVPHNILDLVRTTVPDAQVCHRLDKDTSGVLAIAKNPEAYRHMSLQFEHRTVNKVYHAVVDGLHHFENTAVSLPLLKMNNGTVRISKREGKEAITYFETEQTYRHHTLVKCRPVTGRMHQIRVHVASLGAPITGDELYGGRLFYLSQIKRNYHQKKNDTEKPMMERMALHAFSIEFEDLAGVRHTVNCPYPKDMTALLRQLALNR